MNFKLKIWTQKSSQDEGKLQVIEAREISPEASFLEMLDQVNEDLLKKKQEPIAFEHDCREGICGSCSLVINGEAHGPQKGITTCQLYMREFQDGEEIYIEPFRAKAFPVIRDLIVDRSAFDRIQKAGGYVSVDVGSASSANSILVSKEDADEAFASAVCIGCGACVASCKNASASLFVAARISQFSSLPQGKIEEKDRVFKMTSQMDKEGFGACSHTGTCALVCPKEISLENIAKMHGKFIQFSVKTKKRK